MFRNAYQHGRLSLLYSCGASPLELWDMKVTNGYIRRVVDQDVGTLALEITGSNVATCYIICPKNPKATLGIQMQFLIMIIKNMKKYFTFEITVLDDKNTHRRFRVSNFQSTTRVRHFCTMMPIGLNGGWNQIQFNLSDFTRRAYGTNYLETTKIQIHANCRIRRIYFADKMYPEEEIPDEYRLYMPVKTGSKQPKKERPSIKTEPETKPTVKTEPAPLADEIKVEKQTDDASSAEAPEVSDSEDTNEKEAPFSEPPTSDISEDEAAKDDEHEIEDEGLDQSQQQDDEAEDAEEVLLVTA